MDQHDRLPAPVQPGRGGGLLAVPARGRQQADHRNLRPVRPGAGAEQRLLCLQRQLLRPVVLYAGADPGGHDGESLGGPGHRSGAPHRPGGLADDRHPGLCPGAGERRGELVPGRGRKPGAVPGGAGLRAGGAGPLPRHCPLSGGPEDLLPPDAGGGAGFQLRVRHRAHRHRQIWPVELRQRPGGTVPGVHRPAGPLPRRGLADRHLQRPRQPGPVDGQELHAVL